MKKTELIKEVKSKIETLTYEGIDEAINLVKEHGNVDFFDTFLGDLQLRCDRYNSDHVCSEAFKMLENKAEVLPLKKHGNIPL